MGGLELPWLADIEQDEFGHVGLGGLLAVLEEDFGGDLGFKHGFRISSARLLRSWDGTILPASVPMPPSCPGSRRPGSVFFPIRAGPVGAKL